MKIIATHVNADFDGFAAMLGLWKLYPESRMVFPGAKEPGLRQFLKESAMEIPEIPAREARNVERIFLVDVGREERLGLLADLLHQDPQPEIEIYDHHPAEQITIRADKAHLFPYGSTTTIVVNELMAAGACLTSMEASVILAGIYEDTANFLSTGTTPQDLKAALWLMDQGAELTVINRILTHRLQPEQVAFFNTMVSNCETVNIEGRPVVLSTFSWPVFVPEAAYLVHRLMDLQPIDVFFALILMGDRVHIIARSVAPDVDVGRFMTLLGGGGHRNAASTVLKNATVIEAREKLLAILLENLRRLETARDLMKNPVITIDASKKISDAAEMMNGYRINALTVARRNRVVGTISRQIADGAIFHGLSERPVKDYMVTDLPLIDPETPVHDILAKMMSGRTRFVLVGKDPAHVEGIITRTDLLRFHYEFSSEGLPLRKGKRSENLRAMLEKRLPQRVFQLFDEAGRTAESINCRIYLVGGMVRDLLLHRENMDVDLVVEGDGIRFAEEFGKIYGCEIAVHPRFGTSTLVFSDGFKIDIATARTESYHAPAALPSVLGGALRQDLYRRDFTINTLAIDLSPRHFGALIDYFGGWEDLHQGIIRVLHSLSFIDDPTRTLRAVRFATRFNFRISSDTHRLIESAVEARVLAKLSGKRLWSELRNILQEEHPIPSMRILHQYNLLSFIHPGVSLDSFLLNLFYQVQTVLDWFHVTFPKEKINRWLLYLMALLEKLDRVERMEVSQRFQLTTGVQEILKFYKANTKDIRARLIGRSEMTAGDLYFSLQEFPLEVLLYSMARFSEEHIRREIVRYLSALRNVKLEIKGNDVLKLGLSRGPNVKEVLEEVLRARLNGQAPDRPSQLQAATRAIERLSAQS
jgi:tRNA nucleotidyltransferase (CCA-adding enzyme)